MTMRLVTPASPSAGEEIADRSETRRCAKTTPARSGSGLPRRSPGLGSRRAEADSLWSSDPGPGSARYPGRWLANRIDPRRPRLGSRGHRSISVTRAPAGTLGSASCCRPEPLRARQNNKGRPRIVHASGGLVRIILPSSISPEATFGTELGRGAGSGWPSAASALDPLVRGHHYGGGCRRVGPRGSR